MAEPGLGNVKTWSSQSWTARSAISLPPLARSMPL